MKLLALDLATKTGWALFDGGEYVASGVLDLDDEVSRAEKASESESERHARRASALDLELRQLLPGVDVLALELVGSAALRGSAAALCKGVLLGVAYANAWRHDCALRPVAVQSARKALLGRQSREPLPKGLTEKARARAVERRRKDVKGAVLAEARRRFGPDVKDDNEADALAVALAALGRP